MTITQEVEELHAFAQSADHHLRAGDHFADDGGDLWRTEIEGAVKSLDVVEDFRVREVRVVQGRDLDAVFVDEFGIAGVQPAVFDGLLVEEGAGVGGGERDLDGVRVDVGWRT